MNGCGAGFYQRVRRSSVADTIPVTSGLQLSRYPAYLQLERRAGAGCKSYLYRLVFVRTVFLNFHIHVRQWLARFGSNASVS